MKIFSPYIAGPAPQFNVKRLSPEPGKEQNQLQLNKLKKACREFEAIFISYILKNMRKTTQQSDLFGSGLGSDIYQQIFDEKLADAMSESNQLKIADLLYNRYASLVADQKAPPGELDIRIAHEANPLRIDPQPDATGTFIPAPQRLDQVGPDRNPASSIDRLISRFDNIINQAAEKFGLKAGLIKALIRQESAGNPEAVSDKGAKGLMQLMDSTASVLGVTDPFNPVQNIMGGARYLSQLLKRFGGDLVKAIASYNAGPGAVEKYNGIPPYAETREYVRNILSTMNIE
jgi:soluble lytic murein transglycosylase-like protein